MSRHDIFRGDKVHVLSRRCSSCIFWPGNRMDLRSGAMAEVIRRNLEPGVLLQCHQTLAYGPDPDVGGAACRGFWDAYGDDLVVVQLARAMDIVEVVDPPGE